MNNYFSFSLFQDNFFSNEDIPEKIVEAITISVESECLEVLLVLLKYLVHISCRKNQDKQQIKIIQELLYQKYRNAHNPHNDHENDNLLMAVKKSPKLIPAQCLVLCIEAMVYDERSPEIKNFEEHLKTLLGSEQQSFYDDIEIVKQFHNIQNGDFGIEIWQNIMLICPTVLHWMAILNDGTAIEVSEVVYLLIVIS